MAEEQVFHMQDTKKTTMFNYLNHYNANVFVITILNIEYGIIKMKKKNEGGGGT